MTDRLRIAAVEPYAALSHRLFLEGLERHSRHAITVSTLPARAWKWRMRTSALHFAGELVAGAPWDLFFVSDYLNLAELRAILPEPLRGLPAITYFHENQLSYPLQEGEARDHHFGLTHLYSILGSSLSLFNSEHHLGEFRRALEELLGHVPDVDVRAPMERVRQTCRVLPLGTDLPAAEPRSSPGREPVILWNHRWEYDKDPDTFVDGLVELKRRGVRFRVRVLGQSFRELPAARARLERELADRVEGVGFLADRAAYAEALRAADVVVSTARHEFFGLATLEALRSGLYPVLPDHLAYPELMPEELCELFLHDRSRPLADVLAGALENVRGAALMEERRRLVASTERFTWAELAPRFDRAFEEVAGSRP